MRAGGTIAMPANPVQPWAAAIAAAELASREKYYPDMVRAREITQAAAAEDIFAWQAIVQLFTDSRSSLAFWPDVIAAADRALVSREEACAAKPGNAGLQARLVRVRWLHQLLAYYFAFAGRDALPPFPAIPIEAGA